MNTIIQRYLHYIPPPDDTTPHDVPALSLSGTGSLLLDDLTLYVTSGSNYEGYTSSLMGAYPYITSGFSGTSTTIDLHKKLVSQVAAQLPSGITAILTQDGPAELLLYPTGYGDPQSGQLPAQLTLATSPLWQLLATISREKTITRRYAQSMIQQINLRAASGALLQWWAANLGITPYPGEPDSLFVLRLAGMAFGPNVNNVAIEQLFASLGYGISCNDSAPGQMQVVVNSYPVNPPSNWVYSAGQLLDIVDQMKASGIIVSFYTEVTLSDNFAFSDLLTVTGPTGNAVYGESDYGVGTYG